MLLVRELHQRGIIKTKKEADLLEQEVKSLGKKEEEIILKRKITSEEELFRIKSEKFKVPLREVTADKVLLDTLELIPEETAKYYQMIPIQKDDGVLEIGMVYPEDLKAQEALKFLSLQGGFEYKIFLITFTIFDDLLKQYRTLKKEVSSALEELETELETEKAGEEDEPSEAEFKQMAEEAPITKIVAVILRHAVDGNASDIHIEPTRTQLRVRFRFLGLLHSSIYLPIKVHPAVVARIKIISHLRIDESRIPQDGRFSAKLSDKSIDFRVSTLPTALGEKVVIRVLDPTTGVKDFENLGLEGSNLDTVKKGTDKPYGLILATGPTGSGKTTTLYAVLHLLNKEEVNIITLEDPVEYFIDGVNQSQVKPDIGYSFASGLRHILRQDPDIIMVGEIRDEETANLVIHAALTGHIVLSTLHTNSAVGVISRLADMGIKPYLISPSLNLAIAQRLVGRLCNNCKQKIEASPEMEKLIREEVEGMPSSIKEKIKIEKPLYLYKKVGCPKCQETGFSDRMGVFEVLKMNDSLAETILESPSEAMVAKEARKQEMLTMRQDGIIKVLKGVTSLEEILRVTEGIESKSEPEKENKN
jgi:type IV pilus assembly protein PilB